MKIKKWMWTVGAIILVVLLVSIGVRWLSPSFSAQNLTEEEAKTVALEKYPGDIIKTTKTRDEYQIEMQLETGIYFIKINAKSGDVLSLERLQQKEEPPVDKSPIQLTQKEIEEHIATQGELQSIELIQETDRSYYQAIVSKDNEEISLKVDPFTAEIIDSTKVPAQTTDENKVITEQEAIEIAANHLQGIAEDEPEFHQISGQTPYYLVEVEIENGDDDREATVQVDAFTGEVKSVSWDD